jgi:hypothetical protein
MVITVTLLLRRLLRTGLPTSSSYLLLSSFAPKNVIKKDDALSKCKLVKFRVVSHTVWVCLKAVITEKTLKEE